MPTVSLPGTGARAEDLFDRLRGMNIFVRYFKGPRTGDRLRITIGTDDEMDVLLAALAELDRSELELILSLYVEGDSMTVTTYAKQKGLTRWSARELHKSAIRKLRLHYRKKRLFWNV